MQQAECCADQSSNKDSGPEIRPVVDSEPATERAGRHNPSLLHEDHPARVSGGQIEIMRNRNYEQAVRA